MNIKHLSLVVASAFTLAACSGGGGNSTPSNEANANPAAAASPVPATNPAPAQNTPGNSISGSVDAAFVAKSTPRMTLASVGTQVSSKPTPFTQGSDGAVTVLGGFTLTGSPIGVQEIAGNANFALGRWNLGTATMLNGPETLTDAKSYHYVLFNQLAALPTNGTMTCNAGKFTKPSYVNGGTSPAQSGILGASTGSAGITFDGNGGHVSLTITTTGNGSSGTANMQGDIAKVDASYFGASGGSVALGDAGNGAVFVIASYTMVLANNNSYRGMAVFTCQ